MNETNASRSFASRLVRRPKIVTVDDSAPLNSAEELKTLQPWEWSTPKGPQLLQLLVWQAGGEPVHIRRHVPDTVLKANGFPAGEIEYIKTHPRFSSAEAEATHGPVLELLKKKLLHAAKAVMAEADGVILLGNYYDLPPPPGQPPHPAMVHAPLRDMRRDIESMMYDVAEEKALPLFGICGGLAVIADKNGCSRNQNLPDRKHLLPHETGVSTSKQDFAKAIEDIEITGTCILPLLESGNPVTTMTLIDTQSILYDIVRRSRGLSVETALETPLTADIVCRHHQGMFLKDINAKRIITTAIASDGVVEGIQLRSDISPCIFAVQGHSEIGIGETICPLLDMLVGMSALQRDRRANQLPPATYMEYQTLADAVKSRER